MSQNKYLHIYNYLKEKILSKEFKPGEKLPSENYLTQTFNVSRNTVRRAISMLASDGIVTSVHGKGVFIMEAQPLNFMVGGLQGFKEASTYNSVEYSTSIPVFEDLIADDSISKVSKFLVGANLLKIYRVRNINGENVILDINYFNKSVVSGLTVDMAKDSIYAYIEKELGLKISGAQKLISVEPATKDDKIYLDLKDNKLVAVVKNFVYLDDSTLFEYTESRHRPDRFTFSTFARRNY